MEKVILAILIIGVIYLIITVWILRIAINTISDIVHNTVDALKKSTYIMETHLKKQHGINVEDEDRND